ncbi:MAG: hypothetical protein OXS28_05900 [Gammaproteobacteria bacterium]|nr:hypothetical protein [Gammaproteobacteria bacterium]MDE0286452.1 hypothetical protein [Gammaproteobacteria bacterium]
MQTEATQVNQNVRYEPDERLSPSLTLGLGFQYAALIVGGIVLTPAIIVRAAGESEIYLAWAVFAALAVSGFTTVIQAVRVGRIGSGYPLLMGTSGAFIAVSVTALAEGGPAMLATLVIISSLFQFALSEHLALFRRLITPAVAGTVIMLISVTIMPIAFDMLTQVPAGTPAAAAPACAIATFAATLVLIFCARGVLRLWAPMLGVVIGCFVAAGFGLYDVNRVLEASWIGLPDTGSWPGFDLEFGIVFWTLLPAFIFVTLVGAIETIGDAVAIQKVAWREPRATDFRTVQGAVAADGVGNLLSGLAGTVPNTTYSSSIALAEITGVAARRAGACVGVLFLIMAFLPKLISLFLAIPDPVIGAYILVIMGVLFVLGMQVVIQDGIDYRKAVLVGVSFWVGAGFQNDLFFNEYLNDWLRDLLGNGMTAGGLTAILLTVFINMTGPRRRRMETELDMSALDKVKEFLNGFATAREWSTEAFDRLCLVAEETMLILSQLDDDGGTDKKRRLLLVAREDGGAAELEFIAAADTGNIEDRIALLGRQASEDAVEHEISLRLLRHFASSVRHQQYSDADIVTVRVKAGAAG